jgi:hypothetical protein
VKRRQSESKGECRNGEKPCAEKRQKGARGTLAFATEHHVQEKTTGLCKDADHQHYAKHEHIAFAVSRLCQIAVIKERHQQQYARVSMARPETRHLKRGQDPALRHKRSDEKPPNMRVGRENQEIISKTRTTFMGTYLFEFGADLTNKKEGISRTLQVS